MSQGQELSIGQRLKQEREKRKISLESVAGVTRITKENLEALEGDDFQLISAPVFVRGFLRTYASYLGIDPGEAIALYEAQAGHSRLSSQAEEPPPPQARQARPLFKPLILLSLLLAGAGAGLYLFTKPPAPPPPVLQPAPEGIPASPEKSSPAPVLPKTGTKTPEKLFQAAPAPAEGEKTPAGSRGLKAVAAEKTWLRIRADGERVIDVLLQPGETAAWTAERKFEITVGNAGGIELFFDGVSQGRLGKSGQVVRLVLPRELAPPRQEPVKPPPPPGDSGEPAPVAAQPSQDPAPKEAGPPRETPPREDLPSREKPAAEPGPQPAEKPLPLPGNQPLRESPGGNPVFP